MTQSKFERQADFVPEEALAKEKILVCGVGAIGRQEALMLASIGAKDVTLIDFDKVEATNCVTQGYPMEDIGKPKVEATARDMLKIEPDCEVTVIDDRWRPKPDYEDFTSIFMAVDVMKVRQLMYEFFGRLEQKPKMFDVRMRGEEGRQLSLFDQDSFDYYKTTLFSDEQAEEGRCTARATIYTANIMAGMAIQQFSASLNGRLMFRDRFNNIMLGEIFQYDESEPE